MKKQIEEDGVLKVRKSDEYKKSNNLISAKYKSTLIENKLMNISLSKINELEAEDVDFNGEVVHVYTSKLFSAELIETLGITRKNLSTQLKAAYKKMATRQIGVEDDCGNFAYRNLFIGSDYKNGVFKLYYNPLLGQYYREVEKSYTKLSLQAMAQFKSNHSLRLYELLKKECYIKGKETYEGDNIIFEIVYSVAELKLSLGIVNIDAPEVRNILDSSNPPDYERAVEKAKEKKFTKFNDFKTKCIEPAIDEINESIPDMEISYSLEKSGRGGKVQSITFIVKEKNNKIRVNNSIIPDAETEEIKQDEDDFLDELRDIITGIKTKDARKIAEAAHWDLNLIKEKYELSKSHNINNIVGWLLIALKEDYKEPIQQKQKKSQKKDVQPSNRRQYIFDNDMIVGEIINGEEVYY